MSMTMDEIVTAATSAPEMAEVMRKTLIQREEENEIEIGGEMVGGVMKRAIDSMIVVMMIGDRGDSIEMMTSTTIDSIPEDQSQCDKRMAGTRSKEMTAMAISLLESSKITMKIGIGLMMKINLKRNLRVFSSGGSEREETLRCKLDLLQNYSFNSRITNYGACRIIFDSIMLIFSFYLKRISAVIQRLSCTEFRRNEAKSKIDLINR
jgi:hypothetical protein